MTRRLAAASIALAAALGAAPASEAQTTQAPVGASVSSLTIFAGTPSGLWRSRNWGTSWEKVLGNGAGDSLDHIGAVRCILPLGPLVYAGGAAGVFVSNDFGETWKRVAAEGDCQAMLSSRYPLADPTLFVGTPSGLLKSGAEVLLKPEDTPRSFAPTGLSGGGVYRLEWPGPALVVAADAGVLVSRDAGGTFGASGVGLPDGPARALALSTFFAVDPVMFAGVGSAGVFRSSDAGGTWSPAGLEGRTVNDLVWVGPTLYAATEEGLFRSQDLGRAWEPLDAGLAGRKARRLLFPLLPASGAEAFLGTDAGVFWTGDGGGYWRPSGLERQDILALATFPPPEPTLKKKGK